MSHVLLVWNGDPGVFVYNYYDYDYDYDYDYYYYYFLVVVVVVVVGGGFPLMIVPVLFPDCYTYLNLKAIKSCSQKKWS